MRLAACQMPDVCGDVSRALALVISHTADAARQGARLVCFPEAFLHGYVVETEHVERLAAEFSSPEFTDILDRLSDLEPVIVIGLFERDGGSLYNSAVVVEQGRLLGVYRKGNLIGKENDIFTPGSETPVFELGNLRFSINICYDMQFSVCATEAAMAGASLLVCPANNMLTRATAEEWRNRHNELRGAHARAGRLWLLSSDVMGERGGRISYGPTALIDPSGTVVQQLPLMTRGTLLVDVPTGAKHEGSEASLTSQADA